MKTTFEKYREYKEKYNNSVILMRVFNNYVTYGQDAFLCANLLGISLVRYADGKRPDQASFPFDMLDDCLYRLQRAKKCVAICE